MNISIATIKDYDNEQRTTNNERYSKQSQSKPISVKKCQKCPAATTLPLGLRLPVRGRTDVFSEAVSFGCRPCLGGPFSQKSENGNLWEKSTLKSKLPA